jgi:hypothetical protein
VVVIVYNNVQPIVLPVQIQLLALHAMAPIEIRLSIAIVFLDLLYQLLTHKSVVPLIATSVTMMEIVMNVHHNIMLHQDSVIVAILDAKLVILKQIAFNVSQEMTIKYLKISAPVILITSSRAQIYVQDVT